MDEKRREEVRRIVDRFKGKAISQNVIEEFCNLHKIEPVTVGELSDYIYQVEHDEKVGTLFPLILKELCNLRYQPEFADQKVRKEINERNDEVRVNITKLLEEHAIPYRLVNSLGEELGNFVGGKIASAGQTAFNKALEVMLLLAKDKFGEEFNMKHVADYAQKIYDEAGKGKKKALDTKDAK